MYESKDHFFIVTDLYSGGDMFTELDENGCLNEFEAAELMNAMLTCMNYCHSRNLVHLDLKPENVLLTQTGDYLDVKIIDFGLAQYQEAQKKMTGLEGSSYYMSPQVVQRSYIGSKADVWSCGVICHVMMTGYAPFDGPSYADILKTIVVGEFDFDDPEWDDVSEECKVSVRTNHRFEFLFWTVEFNSSVTVFLFPA
jgi:calcium-dependent protein kinase